jgi:hypothetical protein
MPSDKLLAEVPAPHLLNPAKKPEYECHTPTEEMVCMQATVPQHIDSHGHKAEDEAGTGQCDSQGG